MGSGGWAARSSMAACRASLCAARDSCQRPSEAVSAMAPRAASVMSQKRQPRHVRRSVFTG